MPAKVLVVLIILACVSGATVSATNTVTNAALSYNLHGPAQAHDQIKRQLRIHSRLEVDENAEERGVVDSPTVAKVLYKLTPNKQKAAERLFKRFKLGKNTPGMFTNAKFLEWEKTVAKSFKKNPEAVDDVMYVAMKSQLGDEALAKMLAVSREVSGTESIAKRLQGAQFSNWISGGTRADDAFKLFKLDRGEDNIFARPEFRSWVSFIIRRRNEGPVDGLLHVAMMYSLHAHYSDEALAKMILAAKEVPSTSKTATSLQNLLFSGWKGEGKSGVEVFRLLKVDEAGEDMFQSPAFKNWAVYLGEMTHKENDLAPKITAVLNKRFGEEGLAKMLYTAKQDAAFADKRVINDLQKAQFTRWQEEGKNPAKFLPSADPTTKKIVENYGDFYRGKVYV